MCYSTYTAMNIEIYILNYYQTNKFHRNKQKLGHSNFVLDAISERFWKHFARPRNKKRWLNGGILIYIF